MARRGPTRFDRYVVREVATPFLLAQAVLVVLFLGTQALTEAVQMVSREHLPAWPVLRLMLYRFPCALGYTLPMSVGLATVVALGRLCRDSEYTAIIGAGVGFRRLMVPILAFAGCVAAVELFVQEWAGPAGMAAFRRGADELVQAARGTRQEVFVRLDRRDGPQRVTLAAAEVDAGRRRMALPQLTVWDGTRKQIEITAADALWDETLAHWLLRDGRLEVLRPDGLPAVWEFDAWTVEQLERLLAGLGLDLHLRMDRPPRELADAATDKPDYLTFSRIRWRIQYDREHGVPSSEAARVRMYLHRRWTLAASCLLFALMGAPLAVRPERSARSEETFRLGIGLVMAYYVVWNATTGLAETGSLTIVWAWSSTAIGLIAGLLLSRRVID